MFEIVKNEDPAEDKVAGMSTISKAGKIPAAVGRRLPRPACRCPPMPSSPPPRRAMPSASRPERPALGRAADGRAQTGGLQGDRHRRHRRGRRHLAAEHDEAARHVATQHGQLSVTSAGDLLFVNTSNGVDKGHIDLPAPRLPALSPGQKHRQGDLDRQFAGHHVLHGSGRARPTRCWAECPGVVRRRRRLAV